MDAIGSRCDGDIGAGVDEESGCSFILLGNDLHGIAGEGFEVASGEIFFAELDVVNAFTGGFGDFL